MNKWKQIIPFNMENYLSKENPEETTFTIGRKGMCDKNKLRKIITWTVGDRSLYNKKSTGTQTSKTNYINKVVLLCLCRKIRVSQ